MFLCQKLKDKFGNEDSYPASPMDRKFEGCGPRAFEYKPLARGTENFAESKKLGKGGFGIVYKGRIKEIDFEIAVKRLSMGITEATNMYEREIRILSQLKHKHLVQLVGWCHNKRGEYLVVYNFMPNGSLDAHLFEGKSELNWEKRYKIAKGLASALLYLHEELEPYVLHRDIKPGNIMLDEDFKARLGDFGLAMFVDHNEDEDRETIYEGGVLGTFGYIAPECLESRRYTKKSDVYSFGVVLLEIACGRRSKDSSLPEEEGNLVEWVWSHYSNGKIALRDVEDPNLCTNLEEERQVEQVLVVGLWCTHPDPKHRPSIRQAHRLLNFQAHLPTLPSTMPMPMPMPMPLPNNEPPRLSLNCDELTHASSMFSNLSRVSYVNSIR